MHGERIDYDGTAVRISGSPAALAFGGRRIRAAALTYAESGAFGADGGVEIEAPFGSGDAKPWHVRCAAAGGRFDDDRAIESVEATGLVAAGPAGEQVEGDAFTYRARDGTATLTGTPARVRRDASTSLESAAFEVRLVENRVVRAAAAGEATVELEGGPPGAGASFRRWRIVLAKGGVWENDAITAAGGARIAGFDAKGAEVLRARAARVRVALAAPADGGKPRPAAIEGDGGVEVESLGKDPARVTAARLRYAPDDRLVDVAGGARVFARGWPEHVAFERVVFALTDKGIDLRRASQVEVGGERSGTGK
jgi:hypothetical protein